MRILSPRVYSCVLLIEAVSYERIVLKYRVCGLVIKGGIAHGIYRNTISIAFDLRCGGSNYDFITVGVT